MRAVRRATRARLWAALLGAALLLPPRPVVAQPETVAPAPSLQDMDLAAVYSLGETRFHDGDLDGAIEAFSAGRARLGPDDGRLRAYFSVSLAIALLDRFDARGDSDDATRARGLLEDTVERDTAALASEPRLEALARRNLERARVVAPDPAPSSEDPRASDRDPDPDPEEPTAAPPPTVVPAPISARTLRRRRAGVGLLVAGSALFAGSIAVIVDGATLDRRARAIAEDPPTGRQKDYIDNEVPRLANLRYGIGAPILAISTALIVTGAILLRRHGAGVTTWRPRGRWGRGLTLRSHE